MALWTHFTGRIHIVLPHIRCLDRSPDQVTNYLKCSYILSTVNSYQGSQYNHSFCSLVFYSASAPFGGAYSTGKRWYWITRAHPPSTSRALKLHYLMLVHYYSVGGFLSFWTTCSDTNPSSLSQNYWCVVLMSSNKSETLTWRQCVYYYW